MKMPFLRSALGAIALLAGLGAAQADFATNNAAGNGTLTFCGFSVSTVIHPCAVLKNSAGAEILTATNPGMVGLAFGGSALSLGQKTKAGSLPFVLASDPDTAFAAASITAADSGSATASGQNGVSVITGAATAASIYSQVVNGQAEGVITVKNTWAGTLQFEGSADGGVTWSPRAAHLLGTGYVLNSATANGTFHLNLAGLTNFRVRATAWTSGTATVQAETTAATGSVYVMNPQRLIDTATGLQLSIKTGGTAAQTDPAATVYDPNVGAKLDTLHGDAAQTASPGTPTAAAVTATTVPVVAAPTDRSATLTTANTSQQIMAANTSRRAAFCENPVSATEDAFFAVAGSASTTGAGDFADLAPGGSATFSVGGSTIQSAITFVAATAGHRVLCTELQ